MMFMVLWVLNGSYESDWVCSFRSEFSLENLREGRALKDVLLDPSSRCLRCESANDRRLQERYGSQCAVRPWAWWMPRHLRCKSITLLGRFERSLSVQDANMQLFT